MPRFLAVGHVTWDRLKDEDVLGGSASYATLAARRLGWDAAALTSSGPEFEPTRDLPDISVFRALSSTTTRFRNEYDADGTRRQFLLSCADGIDLSLLPEEWRFPDALLLAPVAGEVRGAMAARFEAPIVGAIAQGWLRVVGADGVVTPRAWHDPSGDLAGVHVLFLSEQDLPDAEERASELVSHVPIVALTRGWRGLKLFTRDAVHDVPSLPRPEVDPTGAGDVFAAAFLIGYHEQEDPLAAAAFAACAASCAVEGVGTSVLGDRAEVERRLALRERLIEEGEWDE